MNFFKNKSGASCPPRAAWADIIMAGGGGFLAIAALALLAQMGGAAWVLGSFGASCVLLFGFPESPFSQPRNVVGGHFLASLVGLVFLSLFGPHWWSMALAAGTAIMVMMLTRTVHPPAGSNPVIIMLAQPDWWFLWMPTLSGALVLLVLALFFNNFLARKSYPRYWF